ncbi:WhiB family transcriptional regulator [Paeniglutamicibacter sp.]|uniref:WhiB family transcriptional regulator n=1 Tax=Paeniglutamicibacter sp. TaxID=1934391 RepID=UPI0039896689
MSRTDARRPEDPEVGLRSWLELLAKLDGAVIPCRGGAAEFHSDDPREQRTAARACQPCLLRQECLAFALASGQTSGVWGGTTPQDRRRARREGRRTA